MNICVSGLKKNNYSKNLFGDFLEYLQSEMPLSEDIKILLTHDRQGRMTTGVREPNQMRILAGGRMLIDVLRTLAHEWVHEFQHQKMGVRDDVPIQDIGGPEENMASALASVFIKKFQNEFPSYEKYLYEQLHK